MAHPQTTPTPIYEADNVRLSYQLRWSLTVFWRTPRLDSRWLPDLTSVLDGDGIRILEFRCVDDHSAQFFLSTKPTLAPTDILRLSKGRLSYLLRGDDPRALQRNYALRSVGDATVYTTVEYIRSQLQHHPERNPRLVAELKSLQIDDPGVDIAADRVLHRGVMVYSLHVVLIHEGRFRDTCVESLGKTRDMILRVARSRGFLLRAAGILPDHIHLAVGCPEAMSPMEVGLCFMNNLAHAHRMIPIFEYGFRLGTIGPYSVQAIRKQMRAGTGE